MRRRNCKLHDDLPALGRCNKGDIIQGYLHDSLLKVIDIKHDDIYNCDIYVCEYIEGLFKGDTLDVYPFFSYKKVKV